MSIAEYTDVTVQLDYARATATLPLDDYDNDSPGITMRVLHAIAVQTDACMVKKGFDAVASTVDWTPFPQLEERILGRWSVEYASMYGAERPADAGPPGVELVRYGVEFNRAYAACQDATKESLRTQLEFLQSKNLVSEIRWRAFELATTSTEGERAIAEWRKCSEQAGIVLDPGDGFPAEEYKKQGKEAEIKAYVTHAECARSTGAIQNIYNLRARYELALMDTQQEKLSAFKKQQDDVMAKLDKVIAEG